MLSTDSDTSKALNSLMRLATEKQKPIVFWLGAGSATWAGYPLWQSLTSRLHTTFSRSSSTYAGEEAANELQRQEFPAVFERMLKADKNLYFDQLSNALEPRPITEVYSRMIRGLKKMRPIFVLTTNVDETLERLLPESITVQNTDIERLPALLHAGTSFVCKLHGSCSSVESMVFASSDYDRVLNKASYLAALKEVFSVSTVVFLGYSVRDDYLLKLLLENEAQHPIFGAGPHFLITSSAVSHVPKSIKTVKYEIEHADHRDALLVLEAITNAYSEEVRERLVLDAAESVQKKSSKTVYYLADLYPIGELQTSHVITVESKKSEMLNKNQQIVFGDGFVQNELHITHYSALHDLVVGLICFDTVCYASDKLPAVHKLLGAEIFWELLKLNVFKIIFLKEQSGVAFEDERAIVGNLIEVIPGSPKSQVDAFSVLSTGERIRQILTPVPGLEQAAENDLNYLETHAVTISSDDWNMGIAAKTRGALMHPSIRKMLGVSSGTPHGVVPRWLAFPILRLARVMATGLICEAVNASATRMIWGSERLATAAFSSGSGKNWADDAASYVLTGRFNSDVGAVIADNPAIFRQIIEFRESHNGENFRREIAERLNVDNGAQVAAAVNSGLSQALPVSILEQARNQFSGLFLPVESGQMLPAVWGDLQNGDERIALWRKNSRKNLDDLCKKENIGPYNKCPCGSGESLKFCCLAALM